MRLASAHAQITPSLLVRKTRKSADFGRAGECSEDGRYRALLRDLAGV